MASKANTKNGWYVLHDYLFTEDCFGSLEPAQNVKGNFPHQFKRNADGTAEQSHRDWSLITKFPATSSHDQVAPITQQPVKSGLVPAHVEPDSNLYPIEGDRSVTKNVTANSISAKSKESAGAPCAEKSMEFVTTSIPDAEDEREEYCQPDESWLYKSPRTKSIQEERFIARSKELGFPSDAGVDGTLPGRSIACQPRAIIDVPPPNHVCEKLPEGTPLSNGGVVAYDNGQPLRVYPLNDHAFQAIRAEHSRSVCDEKIMFDWRITKKELAIILSGKTCDGMAQFRKETIGTEIKKARRKPRLTQAQLSKKLGISKSLLKKVETNRRKPSKAILNWLKGTHK